MYFCRYFPKVLISFLFAFSLAPALSSAAQCQGSTVCQLQPGLFISSDNLATVKNRINSGVSPYVDQFNSLKRIADSALDSQPNPFFMSDIKSISFGWCSSAGGDDDSLKDLVEKLNADSHTARNLAVAYLLSGNQAYANHAKKYLLAWVNNSTVFNVYDLNIDFKSATFDGMESGFCNNSWNMALDSMWQGYGLINFSDVFAILARTGNTFTDSEQENIRAWLKDELFPATNAGFHAWTRWADLHTASSAYERYRNDNHISWSLAALAAAAAALNDDAMWQYVVKGGAYDDGHGGLYKNPSNFEAHIGRAVSASGRVYDQDVRVSEHKGFFYGNFSLWALSLVAQIAETYKGDNYWLYQGDSGGTIVKGLEYYAPYTSGKVSLPDPEETTESSFFSFLYEMVVGNSWLNGATKDLFIQARDAKKRGNGLVMQGIGPVTLLTGDLPEPETTAVLDKPTPPKNFRVLN